MCVVFSYIIELSFILTSPLGASWLFRLFGSVEAWTKIILYQIIEGQIDFLMVRGAKKTSTLNELK